MNKKLLSLLLTGALAASTSIAFAEENVPAEDEIMLITEEATEEISAEEAAEEEAAALSAYVTFTGTVTKIEEELVTLKGENDEEFFYNKSALQLTIDKNGDMCEIAVGDAVTLYVNGNTPMVLSYPANYAPTVVVKESEIEKAINVDTYVKGEAEGSYVNSAESLVINVGEETEIIKLSREMFDRNLDGCDLIVIYTTSTFSIPAQTSPEKVIVLNKQIEAPVEVVEVPVTKVLVNGTDIEYDPSNGVENMLPVRKVAEALGFTVEWNGEIRQVLLNSGKYSFIIDENSYIAGRSMPVQLESAPVLHNDTTFVPQTFFTEVLGAVAEAVDGILNINAAE